ncbi:MAG: response regulator [Pseudomonadota bacterium]
MIPNLMLVDDERIDQRLYRRVIERTGLVDKLHQFMDAESALDFLDRGERPEIDAILLDINMPRMSGFDFLDVALERYGGQFTKVAVIMLTTSASKDDVVRALSFGVVKEYINKPLVRQHLEAIDALVNGVPDPV